MSITNSRTRLTVVRPGLPPPLPQNGETVATFDDFLGWISSVKAIGMLVKFDESRMLVHRLESVGRPLPTLGDVIGAAQQLRAPATQIVVSLGSRGALLVDDRGAVLASVTAATSRPPCCSFLM